MHIAEWFAPDGFRGSDGVLGGDLVDQATAYAARDKVQHVAAGALLALLLARWTTLGSILLLGIVLCLAVAWEALELVRYLRWQRAGAPPPWPFATDRFSFRDVVASMAGAILALLLL